MTTTRSTHFVAIVFLVVTECGLEWFCKLAVTE